MVFPVTDNRHNPQRHEAVLGNMERYSPLESRFGIHLGPYEVNPRRESGRTEKLRSLRGLGGSDSWFAVRSCSPIELGAAYGGREDTATWKWGGEISLGADLESR